MSHSNHASRRRPRALLLLALLGLAGCGSAGHNIVISVNPPEASLYINGEKTTQGGRRTHSLPFGNSGRVAVQATAPGFEPHFEWVTEEQVLDMIDRNNDLPITLRQRR